MVLSIAIVESATRTSNHYLVRSVTDAFRASSCVQEVHLLETATALDCARGKMFDLLLVFGGEQADGYVVQCLRQFARLSAIWYLEDPYELEQNKKTRPLFDIALSNDSFAASSYGLDGHHLPLAAEHRYTEQFIPFRDRRYDLSFVGTAWPNRAEILVDVKDELDTLRSKIVVVENEFIRPGLQKIQFPYQTSSGVDYLDYMRITQTSRVSLMIDRRFSGSGEYEVSDTPGPRLFEAGSAGACVFVDKRVAGDKLSQLGFVDGEDYCGFEGSEELKICLQAIKNSPAALERIAKSLQRKVAEHHTYAARVEKILQLVEEKKDKLDRSTGQIETSPQEEQIPVLVLSHNLCEYGHYGGAELYLRALTTRSVRTNVFTLAHDGRKGFGSRYVLVNRIGREELSFVPPRPFSELQLFSADLEGFFIRCCNEVRPSVILVNHLLGFPPSLPLIAKYLGIPYVVVLHDYYTVCDDFNLLNHQSRYCEVRHPSDDLCDLCTYKRRGAPPNSQLQRRTYFGKVLAGAAAVVANTRLSATVVEALSGIGLPNLHLIPPPNLHLDTRKTSKLAEREVPVLTQIAIVGNLSANKGLRDILAVMELLRQVPITFEVFGRTDQSVVRELKKRGLSSVRLHGSYEPGKLPGSVAECQVALFMSIWPETYCMSLTEVMDAGVVPIGYDIGAVGERIKDEFGFKTAVDPGAIARLIMELLVDPGRLKLRREGLLRRASGDDSFIAEYDKLLGSFASESRFNDLAILSDGSHEPIWTRGVPHKWDSKVSWLHDGSGRQAGRSPSGRQGRKSAYHYLNKALNLLRLLKLGSH